MEVTWDVFLALEAADHDRVSFKKVYVDMTGDLIAGLMLSQIVYWHLPSKDGQSKLRIKKDGYDWIARSRHDWWDECRITPKQVDRALKILVERGYIVVDLFKFSGVPTQHIRLLNDYFLSEWGKWILPKGENPISPKGEMDFDESGKSLDFPQRSKSLTDNTTTTTATTTDSSSEPADAGPDDPPQRPSPVEHPESYSVPEIQTLRLEKKQWQQLLENERLGRSKHGVRSGVVRHAEGKLNQHPLEPLMPAMLEAVDKVTVESVHDPGMAAQFRKVIYDKLWQGERPYLPDEILQFAAEESPVESVYFLPGVLSRWRGKQKTKGKAANGANGDRPPARKQPKYPQYNRNDALERIEQRRRATAEAEAGGNTSGGV